MLYHIFKGGKNRTRTPEKHSLLVKIRNHSKTNKLDALFKGTYKIIEILDYKNLKIITKKRLIRVHIDNTMPYFANEENNSDHAPGPSGLHYSSS